MEPRNPTLDFDLEALTQTPAPLEPEQPKLQTHRFEFTGSAGEFFRIWIVNIFLSIVTLGIYSAWAKVRARQYFYANTLLAGHNFEYLGNPVSILKGNLIVGVLFGAFSLAQNLRPELAIVAALAFMAVYPFLAYSSIRFLAANSSYRNLRFRFHGKLGEAYAIYAGLPLLVIVTFGLILPYIVFRQRKYLFDNAAYGTSRNHFKGDVGAVYGIHIMAVIISTLIGLGFALVGYLVGSLFPNPQSLNDASIPISFAGIMGAYFGFLAASVLIQQYIHAQMFNYSFANSLADGKVRFVSNLKPWGFVWLQATNTLAIIFSLGLAIPWARVRYVKYTLASLSLLTYGALDNIIADKTEQEGALGDAATDFSNIDIGL